MFREEEKTMKRMNPIEQSKFIENEFRKYIKSTFILNDPVYQSEFQNELDGTDLSWSIH